MSVVEKESIAKSIWYVLKGATIVGVPAVYAWSVAYVSVWLILVLVVPIFIVCFYQIGKPMPRSRSGGHDWT